MDCDRRAAANSMGEEEAMFPSWDPRGRRWRCVLRTKCSATTGDIRTFHYTFGPREQSLNFVISGHGPWKGVRVHICWRMLEVPASSGSDMGYLVG